MLADYASVTREVPQLLEYVRRGLARTITAQHLDSQGVLQVFTLDPSLEEMLLTSVRQTTQGPRPIPEPETARALLEHIAQATQQMLQAGLARCCCAARKPAASCANSSSRWYPNST